MQLGARKRGRLSKIFHQEATSFSCSTLKSWPCIVYGKRREARNLKNQSGKLGHNPIVKCPSYSYVKGLQELGSPNHSREERVLGEH